MTKGHRGHDRRDGEVRPRPSGAEAAQGPGEEGQVHPGASPFDDGAGGGRAGRRPFNSADLSLGRFEGRTASVAPPGRALIAH